MHRRCCFAIFFLAFIYISECQLPFHRLSFVEQHFSFKQIQSSDNAAGGEIEYVTDYVKDIPIDHFNVDQNGTFQLKYLYNTKYYQAGGPVFMYAGNEGRIENFAQNTGIMFDLAPLFGAAIVFVEHRYYSDESAPFGSKSYDSVSQLNYLSSRQAIADFAYVTPWIKAKLGVFPDNKVILFGGSYGGMLAAWARMKYPQIFYGAWASSAPLIYFRGSGLPYRGYADVVLQTMQKSNCDQNVVQTAVQSIRDLGKTDINKLNEIFHVAKKSWLATTMDVESLLNFIEEAFSYSAMVDYPYPTSFISDLPGWPMKEMCAYLSTPVQPGVGAASLMKQAIDVFYNTSGTTQEYCVIYAKCGDPGSAKLGGNLWPFQACTEQILSMCPYIFVNNQTESQCSKDFEMNTYQSCMEMFGSKGLTKEMINFDAVKEYYGLVMDQASNIIFTNGDYDPWHAGGVTNSTSGIAGGESRGVYNYYIGGAAHHLDLRQPNKCDPQSVIDTRVQIVKILKCWLNSEVCTDVVPNFVPSQFDPTQVETNMTNCVPNMDGYPWANGNGSGSFGTPSFIFTLFSTLVFLLIAKMF